ncbi:MAG: DNA-directed RNA polymerase subunit beta' [Candidatus Shikimatogenerans bostrichidophilus]|nr:MAG: DNA-directed RNA polymerase subunit beta' [Candidatus Shikimatogenerans bostrichidophilus]
MIKNNINKIYINLASPKNIIDDSYGEVLIPETINYKTKKPTPNGLFCQRIFGPIKDYQCGCGKYKNIKYKGMYCDRCGIEITNKRVRRERMGHIKLMVPVVHIWGFKCMPNKISYLINKTTREVENIIYYNSYLILNLGEFKYIKINKKYYKKNDLINEEIYRKLKKIFMLYDKNKTKDITIKTGASAIYDLLKKINIKKLYLEIKDKYNKEKNIIKSKQLFKKLQILELFYNGRKNNKPEYLILTVLPVIPPDLRPLVQLDGGKYASSDLNELYRKIIIRNNRLKKLFNSEAPEVILLNEKRMLQEAVDALLDNSRKTFSVKTDNNRLLKSLSDILKGKLGRFRQNLLGKRVDYSARSVIVVEPNLKLYQCGLPRKIAIELYKPYLIYRILNLGLANTINSAKNIIETKKEIVWIILKNIVKDHPVLLNRAPTLHRFSIQAFEPILIKGKAIKLHPLVCSAYNADFDGDQMAVHLPISYESILEAKLLMLSPQNILNTSNGNPIITPSQDIILGLYYLTSLFKNDKKYKIYKFYSINEIIIAYNLKKIDIHDHIKLRIDNKLIYTTVGRALFNNIIPKYKNYKYINKLIKKSILKKIIINIYTNSNIHVIRKFLDNLKKIGLLYSYKGGLSFNIQDILIYKKKKKVIDNIKRKINNLYKNYNLGFITDKDKYNNIIDIWSKTTSYMAKDIVRIMGKNKYNSLYMMLNSEARSTIIQIRQLAGIRGLITRPQKYNMSITSNIENELDKSIVETPIISNFLEGLTSLEFFISTHGARKGLADTALKTADAGYLTRKLVDVVHDIIIKEKDCRTLNGIYIYNNDYNLSNTYALGRIIQKSIKLNKNLIIKKDTLIDENIINLINKYKINKIFIRSSLTCENRYGVCSKCYGSNLANRRLINIGDTIGIIAAQSIGEPGTQLTLRTFHVGGSAGNISKETIIKSKYKGKISFKYLKYIKINNKYLIISRLTKVVIKNKKKEIVYNSNIPYGSILYVKNNQVINIGDIIYKCDPYNVILISEKDGKIKYNNFKKNINYKINKDKNTNLKEFIIIDNKNDSDLPTISIVNNSGEILKEYNLPNGAILNVNNDEIIKKGKILMRIPRRFYHNQDITGGLPKLTEIFEARKPYNSAVLSEIDGIIKIKKINNKFNKIIVNSSTLKIKYKYLINRSKLILVQDNDYIKNGTALTEGYISLEDILYIKGLRYLELYLIKKIQNIYSSQGVEINNKHFEIIIKRMTNKVKIIDVGDTNLIKGKIMDRIDFIKKNKKMNNLIKIKNNYRKFKKGMLLNKYNVYIKNLTLKINNKKTIDIEKARPATAIPVLLGITKSALYNNSFLSAASFQETTRILSESAISARKDYLYGLKENVIIGNKIPAGTGYR